MEIDFLKFTIFGNDYELTGVHKVANMEWEYDVVNRTNGNRKIMSERKLKQMLTKYKITDKL